MTSHDATTSERALPPALWWSAAALAFAWFLVIRANWWEWSLNPQYSYGTLVPLLSVLLFARRWPDRPSPTSPTRRGRTVAIAVLVIAALLLAVLQPAVVSNADWRMVPALAALAGVTMTLCAVYFAGGAPWLRHFAFPVVFFLVAVPWPRPQENAIMSWLMERNSGLCVEALQWMGYAAEQRGNLIALPGCLLGVEEACSGIRSLQSGIMVALAIGEFFRLTAARRVVLLLLGLAAALAGNALRSLTLSIAASRGGNTAVDTIHDTTGLTVLIVSSAIVLLAGKLLARHSAASKSTSAAPSEISNSKSPPPFPLSALRSPSSALLSFSLLALWAVAWIAGESWFRWHEESAGSRPPVWTLTRAGDADNAREVPIAERTLDVLLFPDTAFSEQWRDDNGRQWQSFYFQWPPGCSSVQSAFIVHDPRVCLGAAGFELETKLPSWTAEVGEFRIPFERYLFRDRGRALQVFHAVVADDGTPTRADKTYSYDAAERLGNIAAGRRNRGLRVLELAVRGPEDAADAEAAARQWLDRRIIPDPRSDK